MVDLTTIEIIHARLFARYGSSWKAKYAGIDPESVAKDWHHELGRMPSWAIDFALENLPPDFPPTAGQFRVICQRAPKPVERQPAKLAAPKPDPERLKKVFERMLEVAKGRKPTQWIDDLQDRVARGETLGIAQRFCLDQAIANLAHRPEPVEVTSEDSRRTDELKRAQAARVAQYLRDHPELQP